MLKQPMVWEAWWATPHTENTVCHWLPARGLSLPGAPAAGHHAESLALNFWTLIRGRRKFVKLGKAVPEEFPYSYTQSPLLGHFGACERQNMPSRRSVKVANLPFGGRSRN